MLIYREKDIAVYAAEIPADESLGRSRREKQAVEELLREAFPDRPEIAIGHHESGAPYLVGSEESISISHSLNLAAIAIGGAEMRIGIDCESADRTNQLERVKGRYLSPSQLAAWGCSPERLLLAWCMKEAMYKALTIGGLPLIDIPLPDSLPGVVTFANREYHIVHLPSPFPKNSIILTSWR